MSKLESVKLEHSDRYMEIPREVKDIAQKLSEKGHEAYLVGGCVRDFLLDKDPKDWDIATDAKPEEVQAIFEDSVYENEFGTVGVKTGSEEESLALVEVTTYREDAEYSDHRHPDSVTFTDKIETDLSRRDFTINAIALDLTSEEQVLVDPYGGEGDLRDRVIRAVGKPGDRFGEDALRMMRAVRFSAQLDFEIEEKTAVALKKSASDIREIAPERVQDELVKMVMSENPGRGVRLMQELGLLQEVMPELSEGAGVEQNKHHIYDVFEHNLRSLEYAAEQGYSLEVRLASLLHDVGKPGTREWKSDPRGKRTRGGKKGDWTFYQHQYLGEKLTRGILNRLKFPKDMVKRISLLVREHMFVYDPDVVTERGVRRLLRRVGADNVDDLIRVREADRIGSGVPKAQPYRLRHMQAMIEKAKEEPVSVRQLKISGDVLIEDAKMKPGPRMGHILQILLGEVLENPKKNNQEGLLARAREFSELSDDELADLARAAHESAEEVQERLDKAIKDKYFVK